MWPLITTPELFNAEAKISSSVNDSPEELVVGNGRPEGSLVCMASCWRCALRSERVCSRVAFLASRAVRRGLVGLGGEVAVVFEGFMCSSSALLEDGGNVGFTCLGDDCGCEDMLWL
jgi:hypothetical protein